MSDNTDDTHCWRQVKSQLVQGTWQEASNAKHNWKCKSSVTIIQVEYFTYFLCQTKMEPLPQVLHRSRASFKTRASRILQPFSLYVPLCLIFASQEEKHYRHLRNRPHQVQSLISMLFCYRYTKFNKFSKSNTRLADFTWTEKNLNPPASSRRVKWYVLHVSDRSRNPGCTKPAIQTEPKPLSLFNYLETVVHSSPSSNELTFLGFPRRLHKS